MKETQIKLLEAHKVYDETLADQFLILAGRPRGPVSWWYASHKHAERFSSLKAVSGWSAMLSQACSTAY